MSESDDRASFRPPEPEDREIALLAQIEAKGDVLERPRCHGYANCCACAVCQQREARDGRRLAA